MEQLVFSENSFGNERVGLLLRRLAPPIMLAQLIQALYNIVDSYFIGQYSDVGLTSLSLIFPLQLLMIALGVGTGVGVNTLIARYKGEKNNARAISVAKTGTFLALINWVIFSILSLCVMHEYLTISTNSVEVYQEGFTYGSIVCIGSIGLFLESVWTKELQANGNMKFPMFAQIIGALVNSILGPILIFGLLGLPSLGVAGAAVATVAGQSCAAVITGIRVFHGLPTLQEINESALLIYKTGLPSIAMQALYTVYIIGLNLVLAKFFDYAVTTLGLYYKLQTFFFVPLFALENCIVPLLSYNYAAQAYQRCRNIMGVSALFGTVFMLLGTLLFELLPEQLLAIFTKDQNILTIAVPAFRIIAISFVPGLFTSLFPVYFQAIGCGRESLILTILRQIVLLVPIAWGLSFFGLTYVWLTFPVSEIITGMCGSYLYRRNLTQIKST